MARTLSCRDVGVECDWHTCADTDEEVLRQAVQHAKDDHGMTEMSEETREAVKSAIKEGPCPSSVH